MAQNWAFVQENSALDDAAATTIAVTLTGVASGSLIVVFVGHSSSGSTTGVNDGSAYTQAGSQATDVINSQASDAWYFINHASGNPTITATFSSSIQYRRIRVAEYSGIATTGAFDAANQNYQANPGTGTDAIVSGNITTAEVDELIVSWTQNTGDGSTVASPGTGFTGRGTGVYQDRLEDKHQATTGTTNGTFTQGVDIARTTHVVAFKQVAGGAATNTGWYSSKGGWQ